MIQQLSSCLYLANKICEVKNLDNEDLYLYNKNILESVQILVTSGRFMIFHILGQSIRYPKLLHIRQNWRTDKNTTHISHIRV